jgi:hypothetical protein
MDGIWGEEFLIPGDAGPRAPAEAAVLRWLWTPPKPPAIEK